MTRKDYITIARAIDEARGLASYEEFVSQAPLGADATIDLVAAAIADALAADNPRFDRERFIAAAVQS